jgi:putative transposase
VIPEQITTDKEPALYPAIENTLSLTKHRDIKYKNNNLEQDHRGIKSRYDVMKGFCGILSALIFCTVFEEIRQHFRMENKTRAERRKIIPSKFQNFKQIFLTS